MNLKKIILTAAMAFSLIACEKAKNDTQTTTPAGPTIRQQLLGRWNLKLSYGYVMYNSSYVKMQESYSTPSFISFDSTLKGEMSIADQYTGPLSYTVNEQDKAVTLTPVYYKPDKFMATYKVTTLTKDSLVLRYEGQETLNNVLTNVATNRYFTR